MSAGAGQHEPPQISAVPKKSILKTQEQKQEVMTGSEVVDNAKCPPPCQKTHAQFDEMNIIQTLHPTGKDYGNMKIDEPKTPYNGPVIDPMGQGTSTGGGTTTTSRGLDPKLLTAGLNSAIGSPRKELQDLSPGELSDDEAEPDGDERRSFLSQRKAHYQEYQAAADARKKDNK